MKFKFFDFFNNFCCKKFLSFYLFYFLNFTKRSLSQLFKTELNKTFFSPTKSLIETVKALFSNFGLAGIIIPLFMRLALFSFYAFCIL